MKRLVATFALAVAWPLLTAGSCATTSEPILITQEVAKPVPVSCVPSSLPAAPAYPDTDQALRDAAGERFLQLLTTGRDLRIARLRELEPLLEGCRSPAP